MMRLIVEIDGKREFESESATVDCVQDDLAIWFDRCEIATANREADSARIIVEFDQ